jgi:hypothetical protein
LLRVKEFTFSGLVDFQKSQVHFWDNPEDLPKKNQNLTI